jgi:hypothetical protein
MRVREKTRRRARGGLRRSDRRDRDSEPLRVFVRILARQAARECFARAVAPELQAHSEVTVQ